MEKRKLKQKTNKKPLPKFFKYLFMCVNPHTEDGNVNMPRRAHTTFNLYSSNEMLSAKPQVSFAYSTTSSFYLMNPALTSDNLAVNNALSQVYSEKMESISLKETKKEVVPAPSNPHENADREQKDNLVRTILSKYLAAKREEMLNKKPEEDGDRQKASLKTQKPDFLNIEASSSDSLSTVVLDESENYEVIRPKTDFPTRSRSAPTNSTAHDSLADICFKMSRFKQQENKSDSYVTCCSDDNTNTNTNTNIEINNNADTNENQNAITKKKLELIFNNQSSDETSSSRDDPSTVSLLYKISCEQTPVTTGSLTTDGALSNREVYECEMKQSKRGKLCQELYLHPTAIGEIGGVNGSTSSLRWKLIISHHGHGDAWKGN